jgi:protein involved in polysaccharide export with SLBB domain
MRSSHSQIVSVLTAMAFATGLGNAQSVNSRSGGRVAPDLAGKNFLLVPGVELSFVIVEDKEPTRVVVTDVCEIEIPGGLGLVPVAGLTTLQAEAEIKSYLEKRYYKAGKGTVRLGVNKVPVAQIPKFKVLISGKVAKEGAVESLVDKPKTVSEAVLEAGVSRYSDLSKVTVIKANGERRVYDLRAILDGREEDPKREPGGKIVVPSARIAW